MRELSCKQCSKLTVLTSCKASAQERLEIESVLQNLGIILVNLRVRIEKK